MLVIIIDSYGNSDDADSVDGDSDMSQVGESGGVGAPHDSNNEELDVAHEHGGDDALYLKL